MAGKILLIHHGAAFLTGALLSGLKNMAIETQVVEPAIREIEAHKDDADVLLLFAGDYVYSASDVLVYLKDLCFSAEKPLCVVGSSEELAEIEASIPRSLITHAFVRPIDVKSITATLGALAAENALQKTKKHILLVDDDVTFLKMMQSWLSIRYQVTVVKSGMQAITYIAAHIPDLILLDYDMPVTPGPQILEMIRSERATANIPVIFLTGKADRDSVMNVMRLKPDGYLLKSMDKVDILASVERYFETKKWSELYQ